MPAAEAAAGAAGAPEVGPRASNVLMSFNNLQVSSWVWQGEDVAPHATGWSEDLALHVMPQLRVAPPPWLPSSVPSHAIRQPCPPPPHTTHLVPCPLRFRYGRLCLSLWTF